MIRYLIVFVFLLNVVHSAQAQERIFVAIDGDDTNAGSMSRPMKTIQAAINKLASIKAVTVEIVCRKGVYHLTEPIIINADLIGKHQLSITNFNKETVTISGTIVLPALQWLPYKGAVVKADIGKGLVIDQLFCNGRLMSMARYPNYDSTARVFNGTAADALSKERIQQWANPAGGYVHALHQAEWGDFHYLIKNKLDDSLVLEGGWQNNRPAPMHAEHHYVENIFEELDAAGEWYYQQETGLLFVYPPANVRMDKAVFERTALNELIKIQGSSKRPVENVTISNIHFTGTNRTFMLKKEPLLRTDWTIYRGGAVLIEGGKNITVSHCSFSELGGNAVFINRYNRGIKVLHNLVNNIGANAFTVVGDTGAVRSPSFRYEDFVPINKMDQQPGPKTDNYPACCTIYDNLVFNIGTVEKQVAGIEIDIAMDINASHNTIYNVPRAGINIGDGCFGGHIIEYNDVFNTVLETGDHGAFNSWGRDRFWLPGIEDVNHLVDQFPLLPFADVIKPITLRNNRFKCEHGWDIDLDDGSSNYKIYNNVCLNGGLKLREGFRRIVENNVIVNNSFHPHVWYDKSEDVFANNIVTTEYAPIRINVWGRSVDSNFFIQSNALGEVRKNNTDQNSLQGDPQFVNQSIGDFRVKAGSQAMLIGFKNFPMNQFGVVSADLKKLAQQPIIVPVRNLEQQKNGETTEWLGAIIKNVETLGEQSASGLPDKNGVLLMSVPQGSIAAKNGLMPGDVICKINDKEVTNVAAMLNELQKLLWQGNAKATVWHLQQLMEMNLQLK